MIASEPYAFYLGKVLITQEGFHEGCPVEARELGESSHAVATRAELGMTIVAFVDRAAAPDHAFLLSQDDCTRIGQQCLKYTSTVNAAKMPVGIVLVEILNGPPTQADVERHARLRRRMPGTTKVSIRPYFVDLANKRVKPSGFWNAPLWLLRAIKEPRKSDADLVAQGPVAPEGNKRPIATVSLLAVLVLCFLAQVRAGGQWFASPKVTHLYAMGAMQRTAVLSQHEWYRVLTAAFLHGNWLHLLMNMLAIGMSAFIIETMVGSAWMLSVFFLSALGGSLFGLMLNDPGIVSVGASGAGMGLLAAMFALAFRLPTGPAQQQMIQRALQFLIPSMLPLAVRSTEKVDYAAHFGGAVVGGLLGLLVIKRWPRHVATAPFFRISCGVAIAGIALTLYSGRAAILRSRSISHELNLETLVVPNGEIPKDSTEATERVDTWGAKYPRDPRVHLFRAYRALDRNDALLAEREAELGLAEGELLDQFFPNGSVRLELQATAVDALIAQEKLYEAKLRANPLCERMSQARRGLWAKRNLCEK